MYLTYRYIMFKQSWLFGVKTPKASFIRWTIYWSITAHYGDIIIDGIRIK